MFIVMPKSPLSDTSILEACTQVFVKRRVEQLQTYKDITLHYIPSERNPADRCSKVKYEFSHEDKLLWDHGPEFFNSS